MDPKAWLLPLLLMWHFSKINLLILWGCPHVPNQLLTPVWGMLKVWVLGVGWNWRKSWMKSHWPTLCVYYLALPWGAGTTDGGQHGYGERDCLQVRLVLLWTPGKIYQWCFISSWWWNVACTAVTALVGPQCLQLFNPTVTLSVILSVKFQIIEVLVKNSPYSLPFPIDILWHQNLT